MRTFFHRFWPMLLIVLLWFAFSSPFFLHGKIPFPGDYQVTFFPPWSQYSQFAQPVKNNAMPDVIDQLYPWRYLSIQDYKNGQIPLWNPYNFAGTPLLANYQSAVLSPMNLLFFVFPFKISWGLLILIQPLLAGLGMYALVRKISLSQVAATLSSVSFMFCGFIVCWMSYGTLSYAVAVIPIILFGLEGFLQTQHARYLSCIVGGLAFSFLSGHFQMSLYVLILSFTYFLFRYMHLRNKKIFFVGFSALFLGILLASPQIFSSIEFYTQSLRSTIFSNPEVIPWNYLFTLISPDFFGNPVTRNDWFGHYAEWNGYIGLLPLLFAFFSLTQFRKNKFVQFFSLFGVFSLLFALPTFLGDAIVFLHIPVLATSAESRIIVLFSFSFAILGGFGLDAWLQARKKQKFYLAILSILLLLVGWIDIFTHHGLTVPQAHIAQQNFILPSILLCAAVVGCLIAFFTKSKKLLIILSVIFLLLTCFDLYRFAGKWQTFVVANEVFPDVGITKFFQTIKNQRTLGNYGGQVSLYYQLPSLEGYDALYPSRIGEFMSFVADGKIHPANRSVVEFPKNGAYTVETLHLLGVNYIVQKVSDMGKPWAFDVNLYQQFYKIVYKDSAYIVFESKFLNSRVFIPGSYVVANQKNILPHLFSPSTNPRYTIFLEEDPKVPNNQTINDVDEKADIISYTSNVVKISAQTKQKALVFLSDTYFPGWNATVDGKPTKIFRADYTFRAVVIPEGKHTVVFSYEPQSFYIGLITGFLGLCLVIGSILYTITFSRR